LTNHDEDSTDMNTPEGYRMTELGPLPEEWRVVRWGGRGEALLRPYEDRADRPYNNESPSVPPRASLSTTTDLPDGHGLRDQVHV